MEVVAQVVSGIASKVAEIFVDPIGREISFVFKYQSHVEKLNGQVVILKNKRQRIEQAVKDAETQGDEIYDDVKQWVIKMNEFVEKADKLIDEDEDRAKNKRCFRGLCPSLIARRKLSKEAVRTEHVATDLLGKGNFSSVFYRPAPERTEFHYGVREYQQFDSRMRVFQDVMDELKESKSNIIGVYGMGGVGKTTLVKRVAKQVMEDKLFDEVVMAEVTQTPDLETIQNKIACDLGLQFEQNESVFNRADRLHGRLKKEKRVLVVLDNIWGKINLEALGIPSGVDDSKQCTIVLTSRDQHVLCNVMNSQKNFKIEVLSDAEAMSLFWDTVGDHSTKPSDFQSLAVDIVGKCGGLPIAIKTIANALKSKSLPIWKNALNQLRNSSPRNIPGMDKDVYSSIKLSYDFLQSEEAKSLFRLCALQKDGSRIVINDLMKYGMGLSLFTDIYTLQEGRSRVHALIDNLKTSCLLLDGDTEGDVKMHDIVHAIAMSIARYERMHNIRTVADLKKEPEDGIQKDATAVSLPYRDIPELPERLECPKLKLFLLLEKFNPSLQIPEHFFEGAQQLRVLEIRGLHFSSLPSSFDCLINLRTLSLTNCRSLANVGIVGRLKRLEILCFSGPSIQRLPEEIGQLTHLKMLDLRNCRTLQVIAPNVISKLSQLEELYIGICFTQWEKDKGGSNASIVELKALSKLTVLDIYIPNVQILPHDLVSAELEEFKVVIGDVWHRRNIQTHALWGLHRHKSSRTLKLSDVDKSLYLGNEMKNLLRRTEYLCLDKLNSCQNVNELDNRDGFPLLKHLHVQNSSEILYIVNSRGLLSNALPMLETLFLYNLINLKNVCPSQLIECQAFSKLTIINVRKCPKLQHLFSFSMVQNCVRLQEIQVTDCENLNFIVGEERESHTVCLDKSIDFTQLHSLKLEKLPQLTSSGLETSRPLSTTASTSKEIIAEKFMKALFNNKVCYPNMENLELRSLDIEKIWLDQLPKMSVSSCQNLTKLTVNNLNYLKFLFPTYMVNSLVRLQKLEIESCNSLEGVIEGTRLGRDEELTIEAVVFPKLHHLKLSDLPKLTRFMSTSSSLSEENSSIHNETDTQPLFDEKVIFSNLTTLKVFSCNGLRNLASVSAVESLVRLTRMEISNCDKIKHIIEMQLGEEVKEDLLVFNQLEYLILNKLTVLESFCLGNYTLEFPCLSEVVVRGCPSMKVFSQGVLRTPILHQVLLHRYDRTEFQWEGNLNSTIQNLFEEMFKNLELSRFPHFKERWHNQTLPASCFGNLRSLVIDDCAFMSSAIPTNLLPFLGKLQNLKVKHCDSVTEVLHLEELNVHEDYRLLFLKLQQLNLIDLPKLKRFCTFNGNIIKLGISSLSIENCPSMETFISSSTPVRPFFSKKVAFPRLKQLKLSKLPRLLHLCKENSHSSIGFHNLETLEISECCNLVKFVPSWVSFQNLITMEVSKCDRLINLLTFSTAKSLVNLKRMQVIDCKMIKEIIRVRDKVKKSRIVFSQLEYLGLDCLPSLTSFCLGNYKLKFPSLQQVIVKECPKMEIFSRGDLITPKLQRLQLTGLQDEGRWEASLNSTIHKLFEEMNVQSF